jgi:chromosome segregation ATPase
MEVIFKGLSDNIASVQNSLELTQKDLAGTKEELRSTRSELRLLENRVTILTAERAEMLMHIGKLEALVPVPPGPPTRPAWGTVPEPV